MKRALVTGGSGVIGAAICRRLAVAGHHLVIHALRHPERAASLAEAIMAAGGSAETIRFDVTDATASRSALEHLLEHGPIQILVNNAGCHSDAPLAGMRPEQWNDVIDVSLNGFFNVTQPLLLPMMATRWGRIISLSSIAAQLGNRGQANYAAAKAGLHGASKSLALELASRGVTVNVVAPGIIESGMSRAVFDSDAIKRLVPMKRAGTPQEVAALVAFLASDDAGYVSAQVIGLNGGHGVMQAVPGLSAEKVALVIPAYNEASSVREVAIQALAVHPWVIVVDDGSTDNTAPCVADLALTLLRQPHNQGKAAALWRGMDHALQLGAAAVITMDADGQHRAVDLPRLLAAWHAHPDHIVIGTRLHDRSQFPLKRYLANRFANFWVAWAAGYPIDDSQSGFRVYPAHLLRAYRDTRRQAAGFVFESEILIEAGRCGSASIAIPIPAIYGADKRRSHFRPVVDILRITRMVAWKLLQRGLYPQGLLRSLRRPADVKNAAVQDPPIEPL